MNDATNFIKSVGAFVTRWVYYKKRALGRVEDGDLRKVKIKSIQFFPDNFGSATAYYDTRAYKDLDFIFQYKPETGLMMKVRADNRVLTSDWNGQTPLEFDEKGVSHELESVAE